MIYVGIDVAKKKHDCYIVNSDGEVIRDVFTIINSREGFDKLFDAIPKDSLGKIKVGLEATGHYSTNIVNFINDKQFPLIIFNPLQTNLLRKAQTLRKSKTDKIDVRLISQILHMGDFKSYSSSSYQLSELKSLTRHKSRLKENMARYKIYLIRIMDIMFPELESHVYSLNQASTYMLLKTFGSKDAIASAHITKLTNLLKKSSKGKYSREKALVIRNATQNSIGSDSKALSFELSQILNFITIYTNEINDIHQFDTPSKLLAFAGLEPSTFESGQFVAKNMKMIKRGSSYLRWALLEAARLVAMRDKTFHDCYHKKKAEGKHHYVANSHVAKKLVRVIHHLLTNDLTFKPQS